MGFSPGFGTMSLPLNPYFCKDLLQTTFRDTVGELIFVSNLPHNWDETALMACAKSHFLSKIRIKVVTFSHKNEFANSIFRWSDT